MDQPLQKKHTAGFLLAAALLCALCACRQTEVLPTTVPSTVPSTHTTVTPAPTTQPETTVTAPETTIVPTTVPSTAATATPTTVPPEPTQCAHEYSQWVTVTPATCTADGSKSRQCVRCTEEQTEVLGATGHSWDGGKTEGATTECGGGEIIYTCQNCGITQSEALSASHSFGEWTYEAYTYTIYYEPGSIEYVHGGPSSTHESHRKVRTCEKCGFVEKDDTPDHSCKRGSKHHTVTTIREVTCSQKGIKRTTCNICGWYEDYEYGDLERGHAWESETQHLTDWSETTDYLDVEILTCTACGKILYYYRWGDGPCICGQTPCVAADDWRDCESYCTQFLMYNKYRISIDSRASILVTNSQTIEYQSFGDCYYVNSSDNSSNHNPDGFLQHPTWQRVWRDYVFNEEGKIIQFTVLWHDMEGNLCSDIVNVPELPELFLARGFEPEDFAMQEPCFHLTPFKGELYPTSISGSG